MDANIDVHGRIVNEKGEPVAGVTVTVKALKSNGRQMQMASLY